jgi:hypothetical protein
MWSQRKVQPALIIDLSDLAGEAPVEHCGAPTTCASCEQPAPLMQMLGSKVAFCAPCFAEMYALRSS